MNEVRISAGISRASVHFVRPQVIPVSTMGSHIFPRSIPSSYPKPGGRVCHLLLPSDGLHVFFRKLLPLETVPSWAHDTEDENPRHTLAGGNLGHYPSNVATYRCLLGGSALVTPLLHKPWQQERRENKYTQPIRSAYPNLEAKETHEFQSHQYKPIVKRTIINWVPCQTSCCSAQLSSPQILTAVRSRSSNPR